MRLGLTWRTAIASTLVAVIAAGAFAFLVYAIERERRAERVTTSSLEELDAATDLQKIVLDLETGVRGFLITRDPTFLEPWQSARAAFPNQARQWLAMIDDPSQLRPARRIVADTRTCITRYADPLIAAARLGDPAATSVVTARQGKARVDTIRDEFDAFRSAERSIASRERARSSTASTRAIIAASLGVIGSVILIAGFATYLTRAMVRPVRRAASLAERVAQGDFEARLPENGVGEIGLLERSFNTMTRSLEKNRDELRELVDEQSALRRVATLVAGGAAPAEVFSAVATEINGLLSSDSTRLWRYEPNGKAVIVTTANAPGFELPVIPHFPLEGESISAKVFQTGNAVSIDTNTAPATIAALMGESEVRSVTGVPIVVDNRLWGAVVVLFRHPLGPALDIEPKVVAFTELVGIAVANAQSRSDLEASRARVVAAADETRRQIERDLHDGTQQRLVTLGLEVRAAQELVPTRSPNSRRGSRGSPKASGLPSPSCKNFHAACIPRFCRKVASCPRSSRSPGAPRFPSSSPCACRTRCPRASGLPSTPSCRKL
jgi:CHASE3 domain sensor protein